MNIANEDELTCCGRKITYTSEISCDEQRSSEQYSMLIVQHIELVYMNELLDRNLGLIFECTNDHKAVNGVSNVEILLYYRSSSKISEE